MLRSRCVRLLHTSRAVSAAASSRPTKAATKGYKKEGEGKSSRKTAGSFRFFEDHVHAGQYSKKAAPLTFPVLEGELKDNSVVAYTELQKQRLSQTGAFKKDQFHELFASPVTLIREETKQVQSLVDAAFESPSSKNRVCFIGERGIGKSTMLAQAQALAINNPDSVIIPISYAKKLVDGTNDYWFDNKIGSYIQPMYLKRLLDKIEATNKVSLSKLNLSKEYTIEAAAKGRASIKFNAKHTLLDLSKANVSGRQRGQIFDILIKELLNQDRAPVFLTVDNFSALPADAQTAYRDSSNHPIHLDQFQVSNLIFKLTSGEIEFKKGAVILATSSDDRETITLKAGLGLAQPDPYTKPYLYDDALSQKIKGVKPLEIKKLTKENVASLVQVYAEANAFRKDELENNTLDQLVNQKYILSGNGNPSELLRSIAMYL